MDVHIDLSATDAKFGLYASAGYELTAGGLSVAMSAAQFQQLCDWLRPWIVDDATPQPSAADDYESWAKQERQREDTATRLGSAAVGAQGDGLDVEALRGMFRALVDAGGPSTVARHGVERGADKWENDVRAGMLAIERLLHPERFDEFPAGRSAAPAAGEEEISPEFTDSARAAIAWVLYHHQGGNSAIGQPLRFALGMGNHEPLPEWRIAEAKAWAEVCGETENFRRAAALTRQPVAGDGMVLVPREPTPEMESAGLFGIGRDDVPGELSQRAKLHGAWAAMLAAAPAATPTDGGEGS